MRWKRLLFGAPLLLAFIVSVAYLVGSHKSPSVYHGLPSLHASLTGRDLADTKPFLSINNTNNSGTEAGYFYPVWNTTHITLWISGIIFHMKEHIPNFKPNENSLPSAVELQREKKIHKWAQGKFQSHWSKKKLYSCVDICGSTKSEPVTFMPPKKATCSSKTFCSYAFLQTHSNNLGNDHHKTQAVCNKDKSISCPRASRNDCKTFSWTSRKVTVNLPGEQMSKSVLDIIMRYPRSFQVQSSLVSHTPNHILMVSFYLPNTLYMDKCNQLYCIYSEMKKNLFQVALAKHGDASFAYCPTPSIQTTNETMVQLAYHPGLMSIPAPLFIESPITSIPYVKMSICVIVRKEGRNLVEWIEFHRMMGYERFILYDNNSTDDPDIVMDKVVKYYNGTVIRKDWKMLHSQTEAYTDCINRYGSTTKWMSLVDVDEFIVPDPKYRDVLSVLESAHKKDDYIQITWTTFGPCGNKTKDKYDLMMELCRYVTKATSTYPKSTIKTEKAAGAQNYGPHYFRMKKDIGGSPVSQAVITPLLRNYHYHFRTYAEYIERRKGPRADRALEWSVAALDEEWKDGINNGQLLNDKDNWILRYHDELKQRIRKVNDFILA